MTDTDVSKQYYAVFNRGDRDGMCAFLTDDVAHDLDQGVRRDGQVLGHRDRGNFAHLTGAAPAKHTLR